jgi:integrase
MKRPQIKARKYPHSKTHPWQVDLRAFGKGRKFFKTEAEAKDEARKQKRLVENRSWQAIGLEPQEMNAIISAKQRLAEYDKTITNAADFLIEHLSRVRQHGKTVVQLSAELLDAKQKANRSEIYLRDLRHLLTGASPFSCAFGQRPIASITVEELDAWLQAQPGSLKTRANLRQNISVLFGYAVKRRILDSNPVTHTEKPKLPDNPPEIFTVDQLRSLLETAQRKEPSVLPMLAIGCFAGVRDAELRRMHWEEIDLLRAHIEIKSAKAKSARRRIIPIQPNLAAWLRPYSEMEGPLVPVGAREAVERVRKAAKLTHWPNNGLRHSFASYRLAAIGDAPKVAHELGHASTVMLYNTYREVVRPEDAERYWKIEPAAESANVVSFAKA